MKRSHRVWLVTGLLGLVVIALTPAPASAQKLCSKTSGSGKVTWKLRDVCKSTEVTATAATTADLDALARTRILAGSSGGAQPINGTDVPVEFNGGATSLGFTLDRSADVVVTFSAECGALGGSGGNIDIELNGTPLGASAADNDQFCGSGIQTLSRTVVAKNVSAGSKSLVIMATGTFSLDDMDVTVIVVDIES